MAYHRGILALLAAAALCACVSAQDENPGYNCRPPLTTPNANKTNVIMPKKTILLWQGVVLLLCFGAFALFVTLIHRIVRTYVYYDSHLLDTFYDAGGDVNMALIACSVVSKWSWTTTLAWPIMLTLQHGIVGTFWYAAAGCIQLFLFSIVAAEIRIKAPGAKTYLQVIYARFGAFPHIIMMMFAFICNIIVSAMVLTEGVAMLTALTQGLGVEVATILVAIVIGFFTTVGGVGGYIYVSFFVCAFVYAVILVFYTTVFYNPLNFENPMFGSIDSVYDSVKMISCSQNQDNTAITFMSRDGMVAGVVIALSTFGNVFVDQSFWQSAVASKPMGSVAGFLTAGIAWFALPFMAASALGLTYWQLAAGGVMPTDPADAAEMLQDNYAMVPLWVSQQLMGNQGDFLMFVVVMMLVVSTGSSQVLAASSIIIYDIYQTYISPFHPTPLPDDKQLSLRMQRAIKNEDYLEYDKRSVVWKYVVTVSVTCLLIPITLIFNEFDVGVPWLFKFNGLIMGCCVLPIALAITWHRVTGSGVAVGSIGGLLGGLASWLIYGAYQGNPDDSKNGLAENFKKSSGMDYPMMTGTAVSLGLGGLLCIIISMACGGCDESLQEEDEWEKTRRVDNPIVPWSVRYAPHLPASHMAKGRPHFYTVRRIFKGSEITAYICGVLLAVVVVLVWPACMLTINWGNSDQREKTFADWILIGLVWGCIATCYLILVPLLWEACQTCCQAYYNRKWARHENLSMGHRPLDEIPNEPTEPPMGSMGKHHMPPHHVGGRPDNMSVSDYNASTMGASTLGRDSTLDEGKQRERWKTFIHLE